MEAGLDEADARSSSRDSSSQSLLGCHFPLDIQRAAREEGRPKERSPGWMRLMPCRGAGTCRPPRAILARPPLPLGVGGCGRRVPKETPEDAQELGGLGRTLSARRWLRVGRGVGVDGSRVDSEAGVSAAVDGEDRRRRRRTRRQ